MVAAQVGALQGVAALAGARVTYVKAHGALANLAADRREVADAIAGAIKALPGGLAILAISGTELEAAGRAAGLPTYSEIFADRARTREGVLQVELAALSYQRTRLVRAWTHLERQRGGFGFVGGAA